MFGADYMKQFGLEFPMQGIDAQGGLLAPNAPVAPEIGSQSLGGTTTPAAPAMAAPQTGTAGAGGAGGGGAATPTPPAASPLGSPLALGGNPMGEAPDNAPTAPAAGMGSPLGKPQL